MSTDDIRAHLNSAKIVPLRGSGNAFDRMPPNDFNGRMSELDRTDFGNGQRLIGRFGDDFMYVRNIGYFHWEGRFWNQHGAEEQVQKFAHQTVQSMEEEIAARLTRNGDLPEWNPTECRLHREWANQSGMSQKIANMMKESRPYLTESVDVLDADLRTINLQNGILRIEGNCDQLQTHERDPRLSKMMPVTYDPSAKCPTFTTFLHQVQPDPDIRRFLQMWFGYCLTGETSEQRLVFFHGTGSNGKSVMVDTMAHIMGPYQKVLAFQSIAQEKQARGSDATPDIAELPGARMVRVSEPEQGVQFAEGKIKEMTGGEAITARNFYKGFFEFVPQFKLTISGNHKPQIRGQDEGIWRRFILVPWGVYIPPSARDRNLLIKLRQESSGILNWMLEGARLWLRHGLVVPKSIDAATLSYREESDPLGRFIEDTLAYQAGVNVRASELFEAYEAWCKRTGERPWKQTTFGSALKDRMCDNQPIRKERYGGNVYYCNIRVELPMPDPADSTTEHIDDGDLS